MKKIKKSPDAATGSTTAQNFKNGYVQNVVNDVISFKNLEHVERVMTVIARNFYDERKSFIHYPLVYNGNLNIITAVNWGNNIDETTITAITVDGTNERNEIDELWDRVLDRELDHICNKRLMSGEKKLNQRYIKANSVKEAFYKGCKENNVIIL